MNKKLVGLYLQGLKKGYFLQKFFQYGRASFNLDAPLAYRVSVGSTKTRVMNLAEDVKRFESEEFLTALTKFYKL